MVLDRIVIVGAGGFGREVADVVAALTETGAASVQVLGFLDDTEPDPAVLKSYGVRYLGPVAALRSLDPAIGYLVGIGDPNVRRAIVEEQGGERFAPVLVHPTATLSRGVEMGAGTVVCAGVRVTNSISIGKHVHLNLNCTVGHDASLGDYVTVSPLVAISGHARLDDEVMIGSGATLNPGVTVGARSVIGSGAAVVNNIPADATAVGIPAKVR